MVVVGAKQLWSTGTAFDGFEGGNGGFCSNYVG